MLQFWQVGEKISLSEAETRRGGCEAFPCPQSWLAKLGYQFLPARPTVGGGWALQTGSPVIQERRERESVLAHLYSAPNLSVFFKTGLADCKFRPGQPFHAIFMFYIR